MAAEQQTLGSSSLLVDVTATGHGIANPAADLAEADLVEADGKQARLSRSSSLGQDPDQIEVTIILILLILRLVFSSLKRTFLNQVSLEEGAGNPTDEVWHLP